MTHVCKGGIRRINLISLYHVLYCDENISVGKGPPDPTALRVEPADNWYQTIISRDEPLAQYRVAHQLDRRCVKTVRTKPLCATSHRLP